MIKLSNKFHPGALTMVMVMVGILQTLPNSKKLAQPFQVSIHVHPWHPLQQTTENSFNIKI